MNCFDIRDFIQESRRLCESMSGCDGCPAHNCHNSIVGDITVEDILKLQRWSDSHPVETYRTFVQRYFPDFDAYEICPSNLGLRNADFCGLSTQQGCKDCWNRYLPEDEKELLLKKQRIYNNDSEDF